VASIAHWSQEPVTSMAIGIKMLVAMKSDCLAVFVFAALLVAGVIHVWIIIIIIIVIVVKNDKGPLIMKPLKCHNKNVVKWQVKIYRLW